MPLGASVTVLGGSSGNNVNTASGDSGALPGGGFRKFAANIAGGTAPYTIQFYRGNPAGASIGPAGRVKTSLNGDGVEGTAVVTTMNWSGFEVGDTSSVTAGAIVRDSVGHQVDTGVQAVIGITRTS